jgi:hypothetical protein
MVARRKSPPKRLGTKADGDGVGWLLRAHLLDHLSANQLVAFLRAEDAQISGLFELLPGQGPNGWRAENVARGRRRIVYRSAHGG